MPIDSPKTLRLTDLASVLNVTPQTVHNMLKAGRIPVQPIEGLKPRRWSAKEIHAWLRSDAGVRL